MCFESIKPTKDENTLTSLSALLVIFTVINISCQKSDNPPDEPDPSDTNRYILTYNDSKLVSSLDGYRFEAAYGTSEPLAYPYLWVQYVDDYLDSTRVLLLNQNDNKDITQYQVSNHYNGNITRYFNHASFPNDVPGLLIIQTGLMKLNLLLLLN